MVPEMSRLLPGSLNHRGVWFGVADSFGFFGRGGG